MREHYHAELEQLDTLVTELAKAVEMNLDATCEALIECKPELSKEISHRDHDIDFREVRIEEECLKIIALHQPVADDLRFLTAVMRVDRELERISDLAVDVAKSVAFMQGSVVAEYRDALRALAHSVRDMIKDSVRAFHDKDGEVARKVWNADDEVDDMAIELRDRLRDDIVANEQLDQTRFELMDSAMNFERAADHATNIAKAVLYITKGEIVRHRAREFRKGQEGEKTHVLFVCTTNSTRSPIAAGLLNHFHGDRYVAESAGITAGDLNPLAVKVMAEIDIDISEKTPRSVTDVTAGDRNFDYVVVVSGEIESEKCPPVEGIAEQIQWEIESAAMDTGTDEEKLKHLRRIRDTLKIRIDRWAAVTEPSA
jgi:phosphate transport system protein